MVALIIFIALVVVIGLYIFSTQRKLVNLDEMANNAFNQIAVQQNSRWDAVSSLVAMTEKYSKHEHDTLVEVIGQRTKVTNAAESNAQDNKISEAMGRLIAIGEQYPALKADGMFTKTMDSINNYENMVRTNRMVYNDSVTKMNRMVRQWPSSFVAGLLHFGLRDYLDIPDAKKDMPTINV
ncbi:MAG: LemA family protein [Bacteroidales bacterium]|nr:LemA family protein [Bacteroidales bacterium]